MGGFKILDFALECLTSKRPVFFLQSANPIKAHGFYFLKKTGNVFDWVVKSF